MSVGDWRDPRSHRRAEAAFLRRMDRLAGRQGRFIVRWGVVVVEVGMAVFIGLFSAVVLFFFIGDAPPLALLYVVILVAVGSVVDHSVYDFRMAAEIHRSLPPGSGPADWAAAGLSREPARRRRQALDGIVACVAIGTVPVVLLLCVPSGGAGYLRAALALSPLTLIAVVGVVFARVELLRIERDSSVRSIGTAAAAHAGVLATTPGPPAGEAAVGADGGEPPASARLPVLIGFVPGLPMGAAGWGARRANALVCHPNGVYLVEATLPTGYMRRSKLEPELDRLHVWQQIATGELWRPERISFSVAWEAVVGWTVTKMRLDIQVAGRGTLHWCFRPAPGIARVDAELDTQLEDVLEALAGRARSGVTPPSPSCCLPAGTGTAEGQTTFGAEVGGRNGPPWSFARRTGGFPPAPPEQHRLVCEWTARGRRPSAQVLAERWSTSIQTISTVCRGERWAGETGSPDPRVGGLLAGALGGPG